mmetsp:Transcript_29440/g.52715  ORF Transcript_29440/g.52715 Transcript_29440/m.52715 type:complete len:440 (-) Transcript_29440:33-1352(-)|eukprot:CAMPEP_0204911374 /NCGR_PEP_ID=MMETSP1397-20131031/9732_1 /ASSEMBLY_ACC=CAM_ASM_000891 /TAXON_ID=49980 /ORGANISM="Climacostomum Climacostomum virens, Strain Stock W-24" /LENGTH=439 /DNA_ID=CAMNT_0052081905 /DNA_START=261 /DNA_END=1580 /DNA_ORIENTATION=-
MMLRRLSRSFSTEELSALLQKLYLGPSLAGFEIQPDKTVLVKLKLDTDYRKKRATVLSAVKSLPWVKDVQVAIAAEDTKAAKSTKLTGVKNIIAVSSCKGGVGKSTVAVNLAFAFSRLGKKVGIFDADIYGPSLPTLVGQERAFLESPEEDPKAILPVMYEGVPCMSYGFAAPQKRAVYRGPIVSSITAQLLHNTLWGDLDYLIVDMPPGTGDVQITLCQEVELSSAVIVTTPQKLSFIDVVKGIEMFDELKVRTVAAVENMAYYTCSKCSEVHRPFGLGYAKQLVDLYGIKATLELPLITALSQYSDMGSPLVLVEPETSLIVQQFLQFAREVAAETEAAKQSQAPSVSYNSREDQVVIESPGGSLKTISARELRLKCACAACIDEFSGQQLFKPNQIPTDVHPLKIERKGNYAVAVVWSDGHRSSIYPYTRLQALAA